MSSSTNIKGSGFPVQTAARDPQGLHRTVQPMQQGFGKMPVQAAPMHKVALYLSDEQRLLGVLRVLEGSEWMDAHLRSVETYAETGDVAAFNVRTKDDEIAAHAAFGLYWWAFKAASRYARYKHDTTLFGLVETTLYTRTGKCGDGTPADPTGASIRLELAKTPRSPYSFRGRYAVYKLLQADRDPLDAEIVVQRQSIPDRFVPDFTSAPLRLI